jgi:hypothetical protein
MILVRARIPLIPPRPCERTHGRAGRGPMRALAGLAGVSGSERAKAKGQARRKAS